MSRLRLRSAVSLDGYSVGPNQSVEHPLGVDGQQVHQWVFPLEAWRKHLGMEGGITNASSAVVEDAVEGIGATIMGRNMFGGHPGPWDPVSPWRGWWGENPPYHQPVFVLTHHPREPLEMEGGTTFYFVTDGIESALEQAREAAKGQNVLLAGGANTAQQYFRAGLVDEIILSIAPVILGSGERLFDNIGDGFMGLELVDIIPAPGVVHLKLSRP